MNKILVTGATGLLGQSLVRRLVAQGQAITAVVRTLPSVRTEGVDYKVIDFSAPWDVAQLPKAVDRIVHLAQSSKFRDFPNSALDVFRVNVESTARLLDYARNVGAYQFIYASSGGVYGNGAEAFIEDAPLLSVDQLGHYLGSKACGEILVHSYATVFNVIVLRPFFMYGPGQNRSMLIPRLWDSVAAGRPVTLQGDHGLRINPIHVEDASAAVVKTLQLEGSATFNIAGPEVLDIREICEIVGAYVGRSPVFLRSEGTPSDLIADVSAMNAALVPATRTFRASLEDISSPQA